MDSYQLATQPSTSHTAADVDSGLKSSALKTSASRQHDQNNKDNNNNTGSSLGDSTGDIREGRNAGGETDPIDFKPNRRFYLAFSSLAVLAMMVSLDSTVVSVALPIIATDLHGTAIEAFWSGTSFLLSSAVVQPPLAALSNIFGRMPILGFCTAFFLAGIILSGTARSFTSMLAGRTIQGAGGGGIILMNDIIITDLVPLRQRGAYFGMIGGVWALGTVSGPVIGGVLAYKASWRWIFYINIPFGVISLLLVPLFIRLQRVPGSMIHKLRRVDWIGNVIFISAATSFLIPITWGGVEFAWSSWHTLVPLTLGVLGLGGFCVYEKYVASEPTIRLDLLTNYNLVYSLFATVTNALVVYGALYFLPLYYEAVKGYNPVISGVALFPATFTVAPASIVAGVVITKTGDFRVVTWLGWIITTLGMGVVCLLDVHTTIVQWIFLTLCGGVGLGLLYTSLVFVNQSGAPEKNVTFAISMFIFARLVGQCLGVAICGVTFQNQMEKNLLAIPALAGKASEYAKDASSLILTIREMSNGAQKDQLVQAYADSLRIVWAVLCALSGVAMAGSFLVKKVSLDRALESQQTLQSEKKG